MQMDKRVACVARAIYVNRVYSIAIRGSHYNDLRFLRRDVFSEILLDPHLPWQFASAAQ